MSVLENFKNIPRSPSHRATGPKCNFFSIQICNEVPGEKKGGPVAPPTGDRGACCPPRATNGPGPRARQGGLSPPPPRATGGPVAPLGRSGYSPPYITSNTPLPSSFESENSTKNPEKKRGVRRRKAAKPCRIQHL